MNKEDDIMYNGGNFGDLITAKTMLRRQFLHAKSFAKKVESASNAFQFNPISLPF